MNLPHIDVINPTNRCKRFAYLSRTLIPKWKEESASYLSILLMYFCNIIKQLYNKLLDLSHKNFNRWMCFDYNTKKWSAFLTL